eukprot:scaffold7337_cov220-Pinguiococcus_pyrenoidosus.AAC.8
MNNNFIGEALSFPLFALFDLPFASPLRPSQLKPVSRKSRRRPFPFNLAHQTEPAGNSRGGGGTVSPTHH